ncbi:olfactory receptor 6N1-like [Bombina bombina]|uniref:olfactory receptor 6N1-like n=1 Tax=Bombina bombina TaxID=8345 RepID=UPI00235A8DBE|nr:olfactory receptor 6N1-like [Bombina bombina]
MNLNKHETEEGNNTKLQYFFLQGFAQLDDLRMVLFIFFLFTYLLTILGNMIIIIMVRYHVQLHTPMYYFITHLSLLEMWYISTTVPKLLSLLGTNDKRISFQTCFAQLYMFHGLGMTECGLLGVMAFDRCIAICNPLRYTAIMNARMCMQLSLTCWTFGFLASVIPMTLTLMVPFCGPHNINHYFCDLAPLLSLACIDISLNRIINSCVIGFATMFNLMLILVMYCLIIFSIMKIKSNRGRKKAFSTCSSHLTVVVMFYGSAFTVYVSPRGSLLEDHDMFFALVYAMLTPLLNPIIYSLRNKEVKEGLKKSLNRIQDYFRMR